MHIRHAREVVPLTSPHGEIVFELIGAAAGGLQSHSVAQVLLPPGKASRRHYHPVAEESYFILAGQARLELNGAIAHLGPGDAIAIPSGAAHQIHNEGDTDLIFLAICVPAWMPDNSVYQD